MLDRRDACPTNFLLKLVNWSIGQLVNLIHGGRNVRKRERTICRNDGYYCKIERAGLWDRKQTLKTLAPNILEEAKEISEAVKSKDMNNLCEELGDLLMVILMQIEIAREKGLFTYSDVLAGAVKKFIRRHPHVFGDVKVNSPEEALAVWKKMKREEKEINN